MSLRAALFLWEEDCLVCPYLVLSQFRGGMDIKSDQMLQITRLLVCLCV